MTKRILVAPLNWGLGHATRCIPIINALITNGYEPIIASDGEALKLLENEFPELMFISLPSYKVRYSKKGKHLKLKLLIDFPKLLKAIIAEKKDVENIVETHRIKGIISDNRLGVCSKKVPSVYMTHQLKVLSGNTTWLSTKWHQYFIKKFDACWVPDTETDPNLSGQLGHAKHPPIPTSHLGPLSRFEKKNTIIKNAVLVLISGPEPQRQFLENKLLSAFKSFEGKVIFVKGIMENEQRVEHLDHMTIYNFMTTELLEQTINESALVICRSGYTSIMDLAKLNKKAFFIPTPGQFEQDYLAKRLDELSLVPYCNQENFSLELLEKAKAYKGLSCVNFETDYKKLFSLFEGK